MRGEEGDRFFLVGSGELTVSTGGRQTAELGPGEFFGEIALLRETTRTATVTARTPAEIYALDRDAFVAAVTGHPLSREAADAVIAQRLATLRPAIASL